MPRAMIPHTTSLIDWQDKCDLILIRAGVVGIGWSDLMTQLRYQVPAREIQDYLNALRSEGKVQRFTVQGLGPPGRVYRATVLLVESNTK